MQQLQNFLAAEFPVTPAKERQPTEERRRPKICELALIGSHTFLIDGSRFLPTKRLFRSAAKFDFHDNLPKMADLKAIQHEDAGRCNSVFVPLRLIKVARNEVENASLAQCSAHRDSRIWNRPIVLHCIIRVWVRDGASGPGPGLDHTTLLCLKQ